MASSWQKFEKRTKQEMRKIYSEAVAGHSMKPRNLGDLEDADGFARGTGPCGDTRSIWLKVNGDTIINANFMGGRTGPILGKRGRLLFDLFFLISPRLQYRGFKH